MVFNMMNKYLSFLKKKGLKFKSTEELLEMFKDIKLRHKYTLGATSSGALLNDSSFTDRTALYNNMIHDFEIDSNVLRRGRDLEGLVINWLNEDFTKLNLNIKAVRLDSNSFYYLPNKLWHTVQVDSNIYINDEMYLLEIKTARGVFNKAFGKGGVFDPATLEFVELDCIIPTDYYYQCQKQMYVLKNCEEKYKQDYMFLACYLTDKDKIVIFKITYNESLANSIIKAGDNFIENNLMKGIAPLEEVQLKAEDDSNNLAFADSNLNFLVNKYNEETKQAKAHKEQADKWLTHIKNKLGKLDGIVDDNMHYLVRKSIFERSSVDTNKLKEQYPKIYKEVLKSNVIEKVEVL